MLINTLTNVNKWHLIVKCSLYIYIYNIYVCACVCVCVCVCILYIHAIYIYTHTHTHTHTHTQTWKKVFAGREIHTYMRLYTHTNCIIQCEYNTHFHLWNTLQNWIRRNVQLTAVFWKWVSLLRDMLLNYPCPLQKPVLSYSTESMECPGNACPQAVTIFLSIYSRDRWKPCSTADWRLG